MTMQSVILDIYIEYGYISSDHRPIFMKLQCNTVPELSESTSEKSEKKCKVIWDNLNVQDIELYTENTKSNLANVFLNHSLLLCDDPSCTDITHIAAIDRLYHNIVEALLSSSESLTSITGPQHNQVPGWNQVISEQHQITRRAFLDWRAHNSLRHGPIYELMKTTRAQFKLLLRQCRSDENRHTADSLAKKLLSKDTKAFWKNIKVISDSKCTPVSSVGGVTGQKNICDMWQAHYKNLLNSSRDRRSEQFVRQSLTELDVIERFSVKDVTLSIKKLKKGKSVGPDLLCSEHLIYSDNVLFVLLSLFFNSCLVHGFLPDLLISTTLIPIVKDKKGNLLDKDNYRPIAITSVVSKLLELIVLAKYERFLNSSHHQFGFKPSHATDICVFTLKQIIEYYNFYSSNVYACFIDASKAFDKVNHWHLFKKLIDRGLPIILIKLLMYWYASQQFSVKWCSVSSLPFNVSNGVRQGGVLSPVLYNVFIDDLSASLSKVKYGCFMGDTNMNHLLYADDSVILAPSPSSLQKLLKICEKFACENELTFNAKKTKCMCFCSMKLKAFVIPTVQFNGHNLVWVKEHKYLGVFLSDDLTDDSDIMRQMKAFYARGNTLVRKFRLCTDVVKAQLFKTFISNVYCGSLWTSFNLASFRKLKISYNNIFRYLNNAKQGDSISKLFLDYNIDCFNVIYRHTINSFTKRIALTCNHLVSAISNSMFFLYSSKLAARWNKTVNIQF